MYISTLQCYSAVNALFQEYQKTGRTEGLWITINGSNEEVERTKNWLEGNFIIRRAVPGRHSSFMCSVFEDNLISVYKELSKKR